MDDWIQAPPCIARVRSDFDWRALAQIQVYDDVYHDFTGPATICTASHRNPAVLSIMARIIMLGRTPSRVADLPRHLSEAVSADRRALTRAEPIISAGRGD